MDDEHAAPICVEQRNHECHVCYKIIQWRNTGRCRRNCVIMVIIDIEKCNACRRLAGVGVSVCQKSMRVL